MGQLFFCALGAGLGYLLMRYASPLAEVNVSVLNPVGRALRRDDWKSTRRPLLSVSRWAITVVGSILMLTATGGAIAAILLALGYID